MSSMILYDLLGRGSKPTCWSLNPWKPRFVLNYKGLDYKTEWVDFVDIPSTLKPLVEPRTGDDLARHNNLAYTIPVLRITPDKYVMDCDKICAELEAAYPEPSIRIDDPVVAKVKASLSRVLGALAPEIMPRVGFNIVTDKSHDYFWRTREARFGMPLEKVPEELGGEKCWKPAEEELREVAKLLKERGGPFFLGKEPSWADFIWAGFLIFAKRADEEIWERCVGVDEVLKKQFEACKPWVEKND